MNPRLVDRAALAVALLSLGVIGLRPTSTVLVDPRTAVVRTPGASAAEARGAMLTARAAGKPAGVAAHDAVGVQRMLMEWYTSDTARASVRDQLAPLEKLGTARADTTIRTLAAYLDEQGSIVKTAQKLHLHRNAVANRLRGITDLLDVDLDDPDQRLALQLACRARLLE